MNRVSESQVAALERYSSCAVTNAIETFGVRLANEGFTGPGVRSLFPHLKPVVGYAVTGRIKTSGPPPRGHSYFDRTDWWNVILSVPAPRIVVLEDVTETPGWGSIWGEVHINILRRLGCVAAVTNGSVRDVPALSELDFQIYCGSLCVSHSYTHLISFGDTVRIAGLEIATGDLLHGDRHGLVSIPPQIVDGIPARVEQMMTQERRILDACQTGEFSLERLHQAIKEM